MEKSGDISSNIGGPLLNVTPSAPPSYDEAVGGNLSHIGLYPAVPFHSSQEQPYLRQAVPSSNPHPVPRPYPVQENVGVAVLPQRPIGMLPVGPKSLKTTCPSCQKSIATRTNTKNKLIKYVCCLLLLGSIVCSLCACLPFCMCPSTKVEHFCPACNAYLGTYVH
ncbi:lipopolysaccharide-induced tumor necrosis factor-alpha factor homolog isoform X2 [Rhodnius prolixus]|uniref:lipopolysaccharide-induced tumor necrosis factor-alpha factor homolog isoform X2 n=1 Tax=Rhodnius prolixus TaxID=13249 RepID=UPI003D18E359